MHIKLKKACIFGLITLVITILFVSSRPEVQIAFGKDYPFEEKYNLYKEYADSYITTWSTDVFDDEVNMTRDISNDSITITVDGTISKVVARYPIEFVKESNGDSKIIIFHEDAIYEEYSNIKSIFSYITAAVGIVIAMMTFLLIMDMIISDVIIYALKRKKKK